MFDLAYKQFFGRVWTSPYLEIRKSGQKLKLDVNQNVYFHTSLSDESIAIVMEIVATATGDDGKKEQWSCGWSLMRVFKYEGKMLDVSSTSNSPTQKLNVYHGSPLALVYLDEPIEANPELNTISGCTTFYTIRTHQALTKMMHLIDENCIIGTNDIVPGLYDGVKDPKTGVKDPFRKPKLLKSVPGYLDKVSINFSVPLEKLEEDICRLLNEDRQHRENTQSDGYNIEITERKLLVGVHNGWSYVCDPESVSLTPQDSANASLKRAGSKRGHKRSPSTTSLGQASALVYRHRIELDGLLEDPSFCVVFTLIYDVAEAPTSKDKRSSARKNPFSVAIRWAAWCPLTNLGVQDHSVNLIGSPGPNPEEMLVFHSQTTESIGSTASLSSLTGGTVTFSFISDITGKENAGAISIMDAANQMLQVPQLSARRQSRGSDEGSGILQEIQVSGRPPLHPSSASPQSMTQAVSVSEQMAANTSCRRLSYLEASTAHEAQQLGLQPIISISGSPSQTNYMTGMYSTAPGMPPGMVIPYGATPRGYMPVEVAHLRDSGMSMGSAHMMTPDLQELPFTPVHAPVMAVTPGMHSGQGLSRAAYAKLYSAGFQPILDRIGEPAEVVDPSDVFNFIAAKEDMDRLKANEIHMQFLAYARTAMFEAPGASKQPSTVFFTFQFYRYPQVTTERLLLGNTNGHFGNDPNAIPCILQRLDKDGSVLKGPPGYLLKYMVDPAYLKPGEGRLFVQHLSQATLHIDVWDGDTLHLIGSCAVELKHLCRQGREAVQVTYELDVISQEIIDPESVTTAGDPLRDGNVLPTAVSQIIKGRLHLRMANVGHFSEGKLSRSEKQAQKPKLIVKAETGTAFPGGSLNAINQHVKSLGTMKIARALPLADTNHELAHFLFSRRDHIQQEETGQPGGVERKRKLARMQAVKQKLGEDSTLTMSTIQHEKDQRNRDLKLIEEYRKQAKHDGILNMLNKAISAEHVIFPSMGFVEFFEFMLRNPYNVEHTVTIETDDPELMVVTDAREWRHFKMLNEIYTSVEEGMFNTESKSGKPEIFLRPKETVHIPFKFLTFKADHSVHPQAPSDPYKPQKADSQKPKLDPLQTRVIKAYFRTQQGKPISILSLKIEPQPHVIDQTFRFYHPEQSFLKKAIRLPPLQTLPGVPVGGGALSQLWVRCSDSNVISTSRKVQQGEPHDIFIKVACGASPKIKRFFLAIYMDPYLSKPVQIWQFYVHAMQRVDLSCIEGQTSRFNLLLRGTQASRLVQCFPSHGNEMQVSPKEPFMLAANTLQELFVGVRPMHTGCKFLFLNVVDIEYHQLIRSWLVCVTSQPSHVVKAYEIILPVGGGKSSNKKISYTNPYPKVKVFYLRTNREDLLQFKESRLELGAGETTNIGLRFAPCMTPGSTEILVFINDEDDKTEETFCVKAIYQ